MDERRFFIALALSILGFLVFQAVFPPPATHPPVTPSPTSDTAEKPAPAQSTASVGIATGATATTAAAAAALPAKSDEHEKRIDVTTHDLVVGFTNRGARLVSWRLTAFRDANGHTEEMVQSTLSARPLDVETGDPAIDAKLRDALFVPSADQVSVANGEEKTLRFEYAAGDLSATKAFTFHGSGDLIGVSVSVKRGGLDLAKRISWGPSVGNPSEGERQVRGYQEPKGAALVGKEVVEVLPSKLKEPIRYPEVGWIGVDGQYFAALWIPPNGFGSGEIREGALPSLSAGERRVGAVAALDLPPGDASALLYVGPKDYRQLAALDHELSGRYPNLGLTRIVQIGGFIIGPIVVVFMDLLRWLHAHIGNYGWSVILLTVMMNLLMSPLRHFGIANGVKMAKIAPEMKVIQERYKKFSALDPRKAQMQTEMSELYARHGMNMGTNMVMGCFPTLLTLPFLWAIYRVLSISIDLRGAEFLWIPDLSHRDPLYITPILMAISMFLQQRAMPTSMDPSQQRMMMVMPIVFATLFFTAPAGLNLYWFSSNLCTLIQQVFTLRVVRQEGEARSAKEKRR